MTGFSLYAGAEHKIKSIFLFSLVKKQFPRWYEITQERGLEPHSKGVNKDSPLGKNKISSS